MTRVAIDGATCQGHGRCALIAPGHFDVDDSGMGLVLREAVDAGDLREVREASLGCPEGAIQLVQ